MLYSQPIDHKQIRFFRSMLWHVLNGDMTYKNLVDPILEDAHSLASGSKDFYTIDRGSYHVIVHLADGDKAFFAGLDTANISPADYEHIDTILTAQRQLAFA